MIVKDTNVNDHVGEFIDWRLNLWGEAIDGAKQPLHPLPNEHDDDHNIEDAIVATTSVAPAPVKTDPPGSPTGAINRPVKPKPNQSAQPTTPPEAPAGETEAPSPTKPTGSGASETPSTTSSSDSFLPSFFPTFGASKRTQAWIYAAIGSIIVFCIALGVYFQVVRRRRKRNDPRDDYDFEMIEDEDELHAMTGVSGRTHRRGGELYNAFAGESDEEPLFSDEEEEPYNDRDSGDGKGRTSSDQHR